VISWIFLVTFQHFQQITKRHPLKQPSNRQWWGSVQAGAPEIIKGSHNPEAREVVRVSLHRKVM
jgi:hypothetical protein